MSQQGSVKTSNLSVRAPELSQSILLWWEVHGRKDPSLKSWMFTADQAWPRPDEVLTPYGIWIAEVMFQQPSWLHDQVSLGHGGATSWRG